MILGEIRDYIRQRGQVSLSDIALRMDTQPDAARAMLAVWIRKGKVVRVPAAAGCGKTCRQCDSAQTELYCWHEPGKTGKTGEPSPIVAAAPDASDCSKRQQ